MKKQNKFVLSFKEILAKIRKPVSKKCNSYMPDKKKVSNKTKCRKRVNYDFPDYD